MSKRIEMEIKVSFDELLEKLKHGDDKAIIEAIQLETEQKLLHALFYAPSSPVSATKAAEIADWYKKFKSVMDKKEIEQ